VKATDGEIGHVEDFLFDDETWEIRYTIVDTRNFWPGKSVLLRPQWIKSIDWAERKIQTNLPRAVIEKAPIGTQNRPSTGNTNCTCTNIMATRLTGRWKNERWAMAGTTY
jgi:hypothetical protein